MITVAVDQTAAAGQAVTVEEIISMVSHQGKWEKMCFMLRDLCVCWNKDLALCCVMSKSNY